ncbi:hypothetical protein HDV04_002143 [Boothiomyces sp. JEL0838]|nr:hypothetical protein HDV04_002143 [Boothiomyces sp. JEL0838]
MAEGLISGFPKDVNILYVEQMDTVDPDTALENAMNSGDLDALVKQIKLISHQKLLDEMNAIQKEFTKNSGSKGSVSRRKLLQIESNVRESTKQIEAESTPDELESAIRTATKLNNELQQILEVNGYSSMDSKIKSVLKKLGFTEEMINGEIRSLSSGWRMKLSLAQALVMNPDVLLLDEPTNALDLESIVWLQRYLKNLDGVTLIIISHDRTFLNSIVDHIVCLRNQKLVYFDGNYNEFEMNMETQRKFHQRMQDYVDAKKEKLEKSIQELKSQARKHGDDKKFLQAESRRKKLEERVLWEKSITGHRYKATKASCIRHVAQVIHVDNGDPPVNWKFPMIEPLRNHSSLLKVESVSFSYGKRLILKDITMNIELGDRVGIVGKNGEGKSTLLELITRNLIPQSGRIEHHQQSRIGYFSQNQIADILASSDDTCMEYIKRKLDTNENVIRGHFGGFGIGNSILKQKICSVSGGQAVRIATALAVWNSPHLLILDEATNHLDFDSISAVVESIKSYGGAVIAVSHDQSFIESISQRIYLVKDKEMKLLENGIKEYIATI